MTADLLTDPERYLQRFGRIRRKDGAVVPFHFNPPQRRLYQTVQRLRREGRPVRIIILKARQMGFSTLVQGLLFHQAATRRGQRALILAHTEEATRGLFSISRLFYDELPPLLRPMARSLTGGEMVFQNPRPGGEPGLRSRIRSATAGGRGVGRSESLTLVHASEMAFWEGDQKAVLGGLMQAVPPEKDTMVFIESTAGGYDYFKQLWDRAQAGESDFVPLFFPWSELPDYRRPARGLRPTKEEERLMRDFGLDKQQLAWRRWCIRNNCGGDAELFRQEYPLCPEEAFVAAGECLFDRAALLARLGQLPRGPRRQGAFVFDETAAGIDPASIRWQEQKDGPVKIYQEPEPGAPYVIGGDTAGEGSDYFVAQVLDNRTGRQVATLRQRYEEDGFTRQVYCLGRYYGDALVGLECNFSTYPIRELCRLGYPRQYVRERFDRFTGRTEPAFGFRTTAASRPVILSQLNRVARQSPELICDRQTIAEMLSFVRRPGGRAEALPGAQDDCVMALAIAHHIRPQMRMDQPPRPAERRAWTADMWEDWENADAQGRRHLVQRWGRPG